MRVLVVLSMLSAVAHAAPSHAIPLGERAALLGGRATVRLAEGMVASGSAAAVLDWGAVRFTLVAELVGRARGDVREQLATDRELGCARIERLAARSAVVYGAAPQAPHRLNDRTLVYAADAMAPNGTVEALRFYIDGDADDDPREWAALGRAIAGTIELPPEPTPPVLPTPERARVALPSGWTLTGSGVRRHLAGRRSACDVVDGELDARATAPPDASHISGVLRGEAMFWSVWSDHGVHAETMVGAARAGVVHVQCRAATPAELARLIRIVEALGRDPSRNAGL